jgi:thymidylate synthase (FAD)
MCVDAPSWPTLAFDILNNSLDGYAFLMTKHDMPKEEARQALPNACAVNQVITTNLRNLINFFSLRLCNRNVLEMRIFAHKLLSICTVVFPEFAKVVGPQCFMDTCKQGKMKCSQGYWEEP